MILASQSPRRIELLRQARLDFQVIPSNIDEHLIDAPTPQELAQKLAHAKAEALAHSHPNEVILGADTIVHLQGAILGKPQDTQDAYNMLKLLSGATHNVTTGVALLKTDGQGMVIDQDIFHVTAQVTFWELSETEINAYISSSECLDKAGAYGIQGYGRMLVKDISGDFYTIVGLPIAHVIRHLETFCSTSYCAQTLGGSHE